MEVITDKNFEEKTKKGLCVVDFFANWCGPCRMMSPILESAKEELGEDVEIYKVNVDDSQDLARQFGVMSIPTIIIFSDGEIKDKHIGLWMKDDLVEAVKNIK